MTRDTEQRVSIVPGGLADSGPVAPEQSRVQPLSVCHVVSGDCWAGAEVQVATLVRALCRQDEVRVSAITLNEGRLADELHKAGALVKVIAESRNSFARILAEAVPFVRQQGVQVLHSHRYKENLLAQLLALRCGVPVKVQTKHGMPEPFAGWKSLRQAVVQRLDRWTGRLSADAVIAVSAGMETELRRIYGARKVVTIRNGIDTANVNSSYTREEAKALLGCTSAPVIGIVGRLEPIKRIDLFLKMAEIVKVQQPDAQFVVAGEGSLRQSMISFARQSGLAANVQFLGHREDIHNVIRAMDVLVMCSDHEGLPMVLLEALWLGVPVVGRDVGGIREVLQDSRNGLCVATAAPEDLAAACLRLLCDRPLGEFLCRSGARTIEQEFSAESNAGAIFRLYRELCER
jgi:glycosyltransferase involved in cell wall biosynthesis